MKNFLVVIGFVVTSFASLVASDKQEIPEIWQAAYNDNWSLTQKLYLSADVSTFEKQMMNKFSLVYYFYKHGDYLSMIDMMDNVEKYITEVSEK